MNGLNDPHLNDPRMNAQGGFNASANGGGMNGGVNNTMNGGLTAGNLNNAMNGCVAVLFGALFGDTVSGFLSGNNLREYSKSD